MNRSSVPPLQGEDGLPVLLSQVLDVLHLVQHQVSPAPPQEVAVVFEEQLVGGQDHVEAVGLVPPLPGREGRRTEHTAAVSLLALAAYRPGVLFPL